MRRPEANAKNEPEKRRRLSTLAARRRLLGNTGSSKRRVHDSLHIDDVTLPVFVQIGGAYSWGCTALQTAVFRSRSGYSFLCFSPLGSRLRRTAPATA